MAKTVYTLIAAASLVTLLPTSQGLAGPDVTVVNPSTSPAITSSVDDPGRNPYQFHTGLNCAQVQCLVTSPPVPQGKRLVIQHWSITGFLTGATYIRAGLFNHQFPGTALSWAAPPFFPIGSGQVVAFDQVAQGYVDGGSAVGVLMESSGTLGFISFTVTVI